VILPLATLGDTMLMLLLFVPEVVMLAVSVEDSTFAESCKKMKLASDRIDESVLLSRLLLKLEECPLSFSQ
jgi:hypothetical protein